ncbi:hypothetical protein HF086_013788 [Spodoptera exigua]|uniref:Venom serine protease 34 n=1 Tax=Spodoptera exigua TaxID=7107 RepID=A0A922MB93_SPOEX|nr:hypothetical protein HF086_013788 [Spodoptera exigua]
MKFALLLLLWLVDHSLLQNACDFYTDVAAGSSQVFSNPNYPGPYPKGSQCRWTARCPPGYNCRINCPQIQIPQSPGCSMDRFLVSRSGDPQLIAAETYCGPGSVYLTSIGQILTVGLISSANSSGGTFRCQITAVPSETPAPTPQCTCGVRNRNRIVGGQETGINEFPMMAALVDLQIRTIKCGGAIITSRHVLTAAHCLYRQNPANYAIVVGEHNIDIGDSPATKAYAIAGAVIHPLYTPVVYDYDCAIVRTVQTIEFSQLVMPVCLPFKFSNNDFAGARVTAIGWGTLFIGGPKPKALMKVDLDVISQATCRQTFSRLTDRQMCTFTPGKDACQDDSGGPLLYTDPATGLLYNVGMVSFGNFCASDNPGVNTRVTSLLDWIVANTQPISQYCVK